MPNDLNTNLALLLNGLGATPSGSVGVRLSTQASAAGVSNVSTTETDLFTYTLPANGLNSNNQTVRVTAWGSFAANANVKTISLYFGATQIFTFGGAQNNTKWKATGLVVRTSATAQVSQADALIGSGTGTVATGAPAETLSGTVIVKVTGTSATAGGDITANGMIVEWLP